MMSLNSIRKIFWTKQQISEFHDQGKQSAEILQATINPRIVYIITLCFASLRIIFYFISINILAPSKLIVIPVILILLTIYNYIKTTYYYEQKGLELTANSRTQIIP